MTLGGIGADHQNDVGVVDRVEVLRARRCAVGLAQTVAGGRVADPGAGVDIVVAERGAHHLLHHPDFLVGAARRGDAADGRPAVALLDVLQALGGVFDGLVPADFAPGVVGGLADHRRGDPVPVVGVAPGEAALDAGMAVVRLAVLVRHHAHHHVALNLGAERAADTAVRAGGVDAAVGYAVLHHRLLDQRGGGAGLHAGAAGDAFGIEEFVGAGGDLGAEAAAVDGQRERALDLVAGAHAARTHDAFRGVELEVGIRSVRCGVEVVGAVLVANVA